MNACLPALPPARSNGRDKGDRRKDMCDDSDSEGGGGGGSGGERRRRSERGTAAGAKRSGSSRRDSSSVAIPHMSEADAEPAAALAAAALETHEVRSLQLSFIY